MNPLQVADSFLVADGKVRGLDLHRHRFTTSCNALGVHSAGEFWDKSLEQIPREGTWFPRFELGQQLALRIRPAPATGGTVRVAVHEGPDPRSNPRVKGPDLAALGELKARAASEYGADEVLLIDSDGVVLEAAYSALLWWEGDTLCVPPADRPILPSVTAQLLRQLALDRGIEVAERARSFAEISHLEVWLANALHGIRPVIAWTAAAPSQTLPSAHSAEWQLALLALARDLGHPVGTADKK